MLKNKLSLAISLLLCCALQAQKKQQVEVVRKSDGKIDILINKKPFTSFLFPDTMEKPVLYPVHAANGTVVTRGFPLNPLPGDPTDHPHHIGIWFTHENVNGLDFWNNSYAIPKDKKHLYGRIKTDSILEMSGGKKGVLSYHANWTNQQNQVLLEEMTRFEFSGSSSERIIDRVTTLKATTQVLLKDAKDGVLGIRAAHALQTPSKEEKTFTDDKGNATVVAADTIANGNYITSEGKQGDSAWSTRARWCKMYGKMGSDSVSISIIDHPSNITYPTYWHARGYGLFAANPLAAAVFSNGKEVTNLTLQPGESRTFRYRMVIQNGETTIPAAELEKLSRW